MTDPTMPGAKVWPLGLTAAVPGRPGRDIPTESGGARPSQRNADKERRNAVS